jgi:hypothetical protein
MPTLICDRAAIDKHLRSLRSLDNRTLEGAGREILDCLLDMHQVTVDPGPEDTWHDAGIPLRNTLSLFDEERRRGRVSEISIDPRHRVELRRRSSTSTTG